METHFTSHPAEARQGRLGMASAPRPGSAARVWAGAVILAGALGLIVLGGCFLIGVLDLVRTADAVAAGTLITILYVMAFSCFAAAAVLLGIGLWGLARVLLEKPRHPERET